jgi:hypothetical protein
MPEDAPVTTITLLASDICMDQPMSCLSSTVFDSLHV